MSSKTELIQRVDPRSVELRAKLFRGLGDLSRLSILDALRAGPLSVGEIVAMTGLSQSNASNHLRCLSECGLVAGEQRGRFVHYSLSDSRLEALLSLADELLTGTAQGVDPCRNYKDEPPT
ncbi:ArsR/SmtB family transcription factor [Rhodoligotrophos defluvii]|uniref:ArsR/SmtB family transcription factor n=1 Tax=Rhodoligotrophos defluvii TaxID=2561934 RepID=UPI0010C9E208|nr:metalloregulator ArsR/SmtB family transcription factor [Rhodoligotrophos defluvii]